MNRFFKLLILLSNLAFGQSISKKALFLGNSYTYFNDLPQMVADAATSTGDVLVFDSNTPGGYTLQGHRNDALSLSKVSSNTWDFVVLQEQSQLPSFQISQVQTNVFPYARQLDSIINANSTCAETVFYMTWGRKNGDASNCATWPPVCTYNGMDSLLRKRYQAMADTNNAVVSPVGAVWKYIRQNYPSIELYAGDESHPSVAGTYAAACAFYTTFYRKDPSLITFNSTLSASEAANIRNAAKQIVYLNLMQWNIGKYDPLANFTGNVLSLNQIAFTSLAQNAVSYFWKFGDGNTSTLQNPTHTYSATGTYSVTLKVSKCGLMDSITNTINTTGVGLTASSIPLLGKNLFPNPSSTFINLPPNSLNASHYRIISILGQEIKTKAPLLNTHIISISDLKEGTYYLQLFENEKLLSTQSFIKQ